MSGVGNAMEDEYWQLAEENKELTKRIAALEKVAEVGVRICTTAATQENFDKESADLLYALREAGYEVTT